MAKRGRKRNYERKGVHIGIPRYNFDPRKGDQFYLSGKLVTIKSRKDDMVDFARAVDGTTGMSVGNLYQAGMVPEDSRFAPYDVRMAAKRQGNPRAKCKRSGTSPLIPAKVQVVNGGRSLRVLVSREMARKLNPDTEALEKSLVRVQMAARRWRKAADSGYGSRDHSRAHMEKVDARIRKLKAAYEKEAMRHKELSRQ